VKPRYGLELVELQLDNHREPGEVPGARTSRPSSAARAAASATSLGGRKSEHKMPTNIKDWATFEADKEARLLNTVGDRRVKAPVEQDVGNTTFDTEREFGNYWQNPRHASCNRRTRSRGDVVCMLYNTKERGSPLRTAGPQRWRAFSGLRQASDGAAAL